MDNLYTLTFHCPDRVGIVANVTRFIAEHKGSVIEADQHSDLDEKTFFMRAMIAADEMPFDLNGFKQAFDPLATQLNLEYEISNAREKKRVIILVSKYDHCLADLLYRWRASEFLFDIVAVISNHDDCRELVEWHKIPYYQFDCSAESKAGFFKKVEETFDSSQADVMVLARFMQILPQSLCKKYSGQIINIHHSFLPSFMGAKPYARAYEKGVKLIGATCHYVTSDLDEGPIIEQDVARIDHSHTVTDLVRMGKDVEKNVLARGLKYHVEDRILLHRNKTIVFY